MSINKVRNHCIDSLWTNNSVLVQLIGLCPVLAVTTSFVNAISLGLATTIVLVLSNSIISILRNYIFHNIRIPIYVIIISSIVSIVEMLIHAYSFDLYSSLGIFIPLIITNCIVLGRVELVASKTNILISFLDGLFTGVGLTLSMIFLGIIREIIGHGTIFYGINHVFHVLGDDSYLRLIAPENTMLLFCIPPGSFILLACMLILKSFLEK
ncbi:MAG: electron transport complex subunit RsxE [Buchnera aphidicola (Eriosoma harunire)]